MNVRHRKTEIGLLRAVGVRSGSIAALFLGKAALLGLAGGGIGFALGAWAARATGVATFELAPAVFRIDFPLLAWTLGLTPAMTMFAGAFAARAAVVMDPAEALREE
jgi:putative ABC transport system permease protein